jgi:putative acetyltransferase
LGDGAEIGTPRGGKSLGRSFSVRRARADDDRGIFEVNRLAFGREDEAQLVEGLRADGDMVIELVAESDGVIIGHVALSRMFVEDGSRRVPALALAPVAVFPDWQRRGVGAALIRESLRVALETGERAAIVLGHAEYYPRFGFSPEAATDIENPFDHKDSFMAAHLAADRDTPLKGRVRYAKAFGLSPAWTK